MKIKANPPGKIRAAILTWLGFDSSYFGQAPRSDAFQDDAAIADGFAVSCVHQHY